SRRGDLSAAFVSLQLRSEGEDEGATVPVEDLLDSLGPDSGRLLISGDAGSGKSTLCRWAALQAAGTNAPVLSTPAGAAGGTWRQRLPFLIRLRDCQDGLLPSPDGFLSFVARELGPAPPGWVSSLLQAGRGLVLLDGLDEVPPNHRPAVLRQIA